MDLSKLVTIKTIFFYSIFLIAGLNLLKFLNYYFLKNIWLNYGLVSKGTLCELKYRLFVLWCSKLLERNGYEKIEIIKTPALYGRDIVCEKDSEKYYVLCLKMGLRSTKYDDFETVGRPDLQRFVGEMVQNGINRGIVLTTGYFTQPALEYAEKLPPPLRLEIVNGDKLSMLHWTLREKEILSGS